MSRGVIIVLVVVGTTLLIDFVVVRGLIASGWSTLAQGYKAAAIGPDAVRRNFQSLNVNMFNFGLCVHIAVDEHYLHLLPSAFLRFGAARPVSIPWSDIELTRTRGKWATAKMGNATVRGPAWALSLAEPKEKSCAGEANPAQDPHQGT
jgi:hypothetical protein